MLNHVLSYNSEQVRNWTPHADCKDVNVFRPFLYKYKISGSFQHLAFKLIPQKSLQTRMSAAARRQARYFGSIPGHNVMGDVSIPNSFMSCSLTAWFVSGVAPDQ